MSPKPMSSLMAAATEETGSSPGVYALLHKGLFVQIGSFPSFAVIPFGRRENRTRANKVCLSLKPKSVAGVVQPGTRLSFVQSTWRTTRRRWKRAGRAIKRAVKRANKRGREKERYYGGLTNQKRAISLTALRLCRNSLFGWRFGLVGEACLPLGGRINQSLD
ncbi:unnamed protein product [Protopolystoma xenopodis]|uniref:Uncharacterized protein n=1 Tax=Protopolystoma xenopodis TaxID=117903 RepID=A0A448WSZ5_9PLAT|nr:unnamed protein product [Protopolystoma xenopodis]